MKVVGLIGTFLRDEDGAVTVDFVVLTSGIIAMVVAAFLSFGNSTSTFADTISAEIDGITVRQF